MINVGLINEDGSYVKIGDEVSAYYNNGYHHDGTLSEVDYENGEGGEMSVGGVRIDIDLIVRIVTLGSE